MSRRRTAALLLSIPAIVLVPVPAAQAAPTDDGSSLSELQARRNEVRSQAADQASQVDALEATDAEVTSALEALSRRLASAAAG